MNPLRWLASLLFVVQMYAMMPILAVVFTPLVLINRRWATIGARTYCRWVRWTARWMIGLHSEIRGPVPQDQVIVASKHQSFFDIILLVSVLPSPRFIMKKSLIWAPVLGWYALRMGCVPVDRGKRGQAVRQMVDHVRRAPDKGQLIIYPQGTRVAPGRYLPYKIGTGALYEALEQDCVPAATNVGVFWPRTGIYRKPGRAVLEFLPRIPAGRPMASFMTELEAEVEPASNRLMAEAGFQGETDAVH